MGSALSSVIFQPPACIPLSEAANIFYLRVRQDKSSTLSQGSRSSSGVNVEDVVLIESRTGSEEGNSETDELLIPAFYINQRSEAKQAFDLPLPFHIKCVEQNIQFFAAMEMQKTKQKVLKWTQFLISDLGTIYDWFLEAARRLKVNMLCYDYTGYGLSKPKCIKPTEELCYRNVETAWHYLTDKKKTRPENIILFGRSLGSGPTCFLAEKLSKAGTPPRAVILQSPLLSVFRAAFRFRLTLPGDLFPNIDRVKNITCPIFVIHGTRDEVVPFWNGEKLFFACPSRWRAKPFWVQDAGHNDIEIICNANGSYFESLKEFLDGIDGMKNASNS